MKMNALCLSALGVMLASTSAYAALAPPANLVTITFDEAIAPAVNTPLGEQYATADGVHFLYGSSFTSSSYFPGYFPGGIPTPASSGQNLPGGTLGDKAVPSSGKYVSNWFDIDGTTKTQFNSTNVPTDNFLGFNAVDYLSNGTTLKFSGGAVKFDKLVNNLSFKYDRPGSGQTSAVTDIVVALYNTTLAGSPTFVNKYTLAPSNNSGWYSFTANAGDTFDLAVVYGDKRFMLDNISFTPTPIPPSILLLGSGLLGCLGLSRKPKRL